LYNRTRGKNPVGIIGDLCRLTNEWRSNLPSALLLRQAFMTFVELLSGLRPNVLWTHIAHSEGVLITKECLTDKKVGVSARLKEKFEHHLIVLAYGGVTPVPDGYSHKVVNIYSNSDITFYRIFKHLKKEPLPKDCSINMLFAKVLQYMRAISCSFVPIH